MAKPTIVVIGARPQRPGRRRLPREGRAARHGARARRPRSAGSCGTPRSRRASARRGSATRSGACASAVIQDLKLARHGLEPIVARRSRVRAAARRLGRHVLGRRGEDRGGAPRAEPDDADAYPAFDQKVRAIASFLAYVNVATPPDAKSAVDRRRDHGAEARQGVPGPRRRRPAARRSARCRWRSPTSCRRSSRTRRCAARSRPAASLYTATGPWAAGTAAVVPATTRPATTAARRARRRSRRAAPARSRPRSRAAEALGVDDPHRRRGRADPHRRTAAWPA